MNGEEIRAARKAKGWTQQELAAAVGTTQSVISEIETGGRPIGTMAVLERIAAALDLTVRIILEPKPANPLEAAPPAA